MNPRRVHELMLAHFPPVDHVMREWTIVQDEQGIRKTALASILAEHISSPEVLVEISRKVGSYLPVQDVPSYIDAHFSQGEIRIADREFTGFVVVAANGVATGWHNTSNHSLQPTASGSV